METIIELLDSESDNNSDIPKGSVLENKFHCSPLNDLSIHSDSTVTRESSECNQANVAITLLDSDSSESTHWPKSRNTFLNNSSQEQSRGAKADHVKTFTKDNRQINSDLSGNNPIRRGRKRPTHSKRTVGQQQTRRASEDGKDNQKATKNEYIDFSTDSSDSSSCVNKTREKSRISPSKSTVGYKDASKNECIDIGSDSSDSDHAKVRVGKALTTPPDRKTRYHLSNNTDAGNNRGSDSSGCDYKTQEKSRISPSKSTVGHRKTDKDEKDHQLISKNECIDIGSDSSDSDHAKIRVGKALTTPPDRKTRYHLSNNTGAGNNRGSDSSGFDYKTQEKSRISPSKSTVGHRKTDKDEKDHQLISKNECIDIGSDSSDSDHAKIRVGKALTTPPDRKTRYHLSNNTGAGNNRGSDSSGFDYKTQEKSRISPSKSTVGHRKTDKDEKDHQLISKNECIDIGSDSSDSDHAKIRVGKALTTPPDRKTRYHLSNNTGAGNNRGSDSSGFDYKTQEKSRISPSKSTVGHRKTDKDEKDHQLISKNECIDIGSDSSDSDHAKIRVGKALTTPPDRKTRYHLSNNTGAGNNSGSDSSGFDYKTQEKSRISPLKTVGDSSSKPGSNALIIFSSSDSDDDVESVHVRNGLKNIKHYSSSNPIVADVAKLEELAQNKLLTAPSSTLKTNAGQLVIEFFDTSNERLLPGSATFNDDQAKQLSSSIKKKKKRTRTLDDSLDSDDSLLNIQIPFSKRKPTSDDLKPSDEATNIFSASQVSSEYSLFHADQMTRNISIDGPLSSTQTRIDLEDRDEWDETFGKESSVNSSGATLECLSDRNDQIVYRSVPKATAAVSLDKGCDDVPTPSLPSVNEIGGRLYPDIRHQCIKALISHAKVLRRSIHHRGSLDSSIRAIIVFAFHPYPIRSAEAAANLKGVGTDLLTVFKDMMKNCAKEKSQPYSPPRGKFSSVAAASLMALADYERERGGEVACTMEDLIPRINAICHNPCSATHVLDKDVEYYLNKENIDPGWLQIRKLCAGNQSIGLDPLIKERRNKASCTSGIIFELTTHGRSKVEILRRLTSVEPVPPGPLRQLASSFVDKAFGSVTMSMDMREGGGYTKSLHKLCNLLDEYRVPYVVRSLKISDYVFFVGNKLAPILIERKSVDDVAGSLNDGRWERQQRNMRKAQYVLGNGEHRKCQICYIIEGEAAKRIVHGGVVARTSWDISLEEVERAIASLPSLGFSVMKSKSHMGTMNILSQVARDICWKYRNGSINCSLTYDEFLREMNRCPEHLGDPPTRPEFMNPIAPVVDSVTREPVPSNTFTSSQNAASSPSSDNNHQSGDNGRYLELEKLSIAELKELCIERDEKISGSKKDLIERLLQERKPEILLTRARRNQYVPKVPSCNAALLVALFLNHQPGTEGLSKERLMLLAEETGVSKDPMGGKGGWYDGWSGIKDMTSGDPPLIQVVKKKYSLTTQPNGSAGVDVASALHVMAHRQNLCRCDMIRF